MKNLSMFFLALVLTGCTGSQTVQGKNFQMTTIYDANAMVPSGKYAVLEKCQMEDPPAGQDMSGTANSNSDKNKEEVLPELKNCEVVNIQYVSQTGIVSGMMGPLIYGGATVGAAYLLGDGFADSGDRVTTNITQSVQDSFSPGP